VFSPDQYRALRDGAGLLEREDRGRIILRGEDRKTYLHGLLSNDILALEPGTGCYAALLTAQGRMISDMRVFELGGSVLLDLERPVTGTVVEHLEKFVITEDVEIEDVTAKYAQLGLYGPSTFEILAAATHADPAVAPLYVLPGGDIGVAGVDLIIPREAAGSLSAALVSAGAVAVSPETAEVTRIEAGVPKFLVDMDTSTIPLEAGIEDRAISMTKGCYVGQEVIVRVLHRGGGRVARKLVGLMTDPPEVQRGDRLLAGDREVGRITSAVDSPGMGRRIALAYVHRDFLEPGTPLEARTARGPSHAVVARLPFRSEPSVRSGPPGEP
jgi:folate-binding protein YgfZ